MMSWMPAATEASAAKVAAANGVALNYHLACFATLIVYKQFSCINAAVGCESFECIAAGASALLAVWDERAAMLQLLKGTPV